MKREQIFCSKEYFRFSKSLEHRFLRKETTFVTLFGFNSLVAVVSAKTLTSSNTVLLVHFSQQTTSFSNSNKKLFCFYFDFLSMLTIRQISSYKIIIFCSCALPAVALLPLVSLCAQTSLRFSFRTFASNRSFLRFFLLLSSSVEFKLSSCPIFYVFSLWCAGPFFSCCLGPSQKTPFSIFLLLHFGRNNVRARRSSLHTCKPPTLTLSFFLPLSLSPSTFSFFISLFRWFLSVDIWSVRNQTSGPVCAEDIFSFFLSFPTFPIFFLRLLSVTIRSTTTTAILLHWQSNYQLPPSFINTPYLLAQWPSMYCSKSGCSLLFSFFLKIPPFFGVKPRGMNPVLCSIPFRTSPLFSSSFLFFSFSKSNIKEPDTIQQKKFFFRLFIFSSVASFFSFLFLKPSFISQRKKYTKISTIFKELLILFVTIKQSVFLSNSKVI